jgi:hypothetical protein
LIQFIQQNAVAVGLIATYLLVALVNTMPEKNISWTGQTVYGWFYDFVHIIINAAVKKYPALAELPSVGTVTTTVNTPAIPAQSQTVITQKETL